MAHEIDTNELFISLVDAWKWAITEIGMKELGQVINEYSEKKRSFNVEYTSIDQYSLVTTKLQGLSFLECFEQYPRLFLKSGELVINTEYVHHNPTGNESMWVKIRVVNVPELYQVPIGEIGTEHIGKMIQVRGRILRAKEPESLLEVGSFECMRCHAKIMMPQKSFMFTEPLECRQDSGGCGKRNQQTSFEFHPEDSEFKRLQRLVLQEHGEGDIRRSAQDKQLFLYDDLGGIFEHNDIVINCIVCIEEGRMLSDRYTTVFSTYLEAISIETDLSTDTIVHTEEDILHYQEFSKDPKIYDKIVDSIAPDIMGYKVEKEALSLQLFGGVEKSVARGKRRRREEIHILMIGDPGTAKTQLGQEIASLSQKGDTASGETSTKAGLTAAAIKDDLTKKWEIHIGALVLCNGGLLYIDEAEKMRREDLNNLNMAFEYGLIPFNKAGMNVTLHAKTSVLMSANPVHGGWLACKDFFSQIDIPTNILDKLDCIFIFENKYDPEVDGRVAETIYNYGMAFDNPDEMDKLGLSPAVDQAFLKRYIDYARKHARPRLTADLRSYFRNTYLQLRKSQSENSLKIGPRFVNTLIRLSEASAKIRLSPFVELQDAERATKVYMHWLQKLCMSEDGALDLSIIYTGMSMAQQERSVLLWNLITDLHQMDPVHGIPIEDIIHHGDKNNIKEEDVRTMLKKWMQERRPKIRMDAENLIHIN